MLTHPYVSVAEFRAHPTFLDTRNLRTGGTSAEQDAALYNALLVASEWADDQVNMPLAAHVRTENARVVPDRSGRLRYHPEHAPVLQVTGLAVGATPDELDAVSSPQVWTEQDGRIIVAFSPSGGSGLDALQFGSTPSGGEVLASWTYVAGFPTTQLVEDAAAGATELAVRDTTGITVGTVLRLWTPGAEEAITVSAVGDEQLTLAAGLKNAQTAESTISNLPTTARQAVISYATAELMRPAPAAAAAANQQGPPRTATSGDRRRLSGGLDLIKRAERLLMPFGRIR